MSVLKVEEIADGRKADIDDKGRRTYVRVFRVTMSTPFDDPQTAVVGVGILPFASYVTPWGGLDLGALVNKIEATQPDAATDPFLFLVTVNYDSDTYNPDLGNPDPLSRPPDYEYSEQVIRYAITQDVNGEWLVNAADDAFDPPVEMDEVVQVFTVTRNEANYGPDTALTYANTTNMDTWYGYDADTVLCKMPTGRRVWENNEFYWVVKYTFWIRKAGWKLKLLNAGYRAIDPTSFEPYTVRDLQDATPRSSMSLLDANGYVTDTPNYLQFQIYKSVDFGPLNVP
jgi:hypothetical protein